MHTYHVSTFCTLKDGHSFTGNVMEIFEVVFVINGLVSPSQETIAGILQITSPNLEPLMSEVNEVPFIEHLNGR